MPTRRRVTYIAAAVALATVLGAVAVRARQESTDPPDGASTATPGPTGAVSTPPRPGGVSEVRQATAPIPAGLTIRAMAFADASTGYALYDGPGRSAVAATFDGGFSWVARTGPAVDGTRLTVVDHQTLVLSTTAEHFVSRDTGRTYTRMSPLPADVDPAVRPQPATAPPVLPTQDLRGGADGRFWAVSTMADGVVRTAVSDPGGRTWSRLPDVPWSHPTPLAFALSRDGGEVWLYGGFNDGAPGAWHLAGGVWLASSVATRFEGLTSAVVVDGGMLMIGRNNGGPVGLIGDGSRLIAPAGPDRVRRLALLPDGVIEGWGGSPAATYLCTCRGMSGAWVLVGLSAQS
jgi:hypothetical protein